MATTTGEDDNDVKDNNSEDDCDETAMTARMTGKDGEDNRQGQRRRQGRQH
jgi:hypothetical protein